MVEVYFNPSWWQLRIADPIEWILDNVSTKDYSWSKSKSWINGKEYPASIFFHNDEDAVVFKLKFPEIIKWTMKG